MSSDGRNKAGKAYTRREALAALATYSAALGGTATTIVTADGLVSVASAYVSPEDRLARFCKKHPTHWKCVGFTGTSDRVQF